MPHTCDQIHNDLKVKFNKMVDLLRFENALDKLFKLKFVNIKLSYLHNYFPNRALLNCNRFLTPNPPMLHSFFNDIFPAGWRILQATKLHDFLPNSLDVATTKEQVVSILNSQLHNDKTYNWSPLGIPIARVYPGSQSILHCQPENEGVLRDS
jgi:hypothetical protein